MSTQPNKSFEEFVEATMNELRNDFTWDNIRATLRATYEAGEQSLLTTLRQEVEKIMKRHEIINGYQPFGYTDEAHEKEIYFTGFDDGRDMMRIDLFKLLTLLKTPNQEPKQ